MGQQIQGEKISFENFFTKSQFLVQEERMEVIQSKKELTIGIPNDADYDETRIAVVPNSVRSLIGCGYKVLVETGAGLKSNYSDNDFAEAGAEIKYSRKEVLGAHLVIQMSPPNKADLQQMQSGQILLSPLHIPRLDKETLDLIVRNKIIALAMEYLKTERGDFPVVRILSEIAGMYSIIKAGELLSNDGSRGILLGGISGVPPAKIVILGAGVVGEYAAKTALGFGASIRIFDNDVYKIMRLQTNIGRQLHTSSINPVYLAYQLRSADVVIGAIHSKTGRSPIIVTEEMVSNMKEGSVIMDISIDQGGCFETSEITNIQKPTFLKHGVIHYCVPNIASQVPRTASIGISNILTPVIIHMGESASIEDLLYQNQGLRNGCYAFKGHLTNEYLSKRFDMKYTNLDLVLTSGL